MKHYLIVRTIYNERAGRLLRPGEVWTFDDFQAAALIERGCITGAEADAPERRGRKRRKPDAELDKLQDNL